MIASYVVAMTIIPLYCARFLTAKEGEHHMEQGRGPLAAFMRGYERFAASLPAFPDRRRWTTRFG